MFCEEIKNELNELDKMEEGLYNSAKGPFRIARATLYQAQGLLNLADALKKIADSEIIEKNCIVVWRS